MSPRRPNATPGMKAKISASVARVTGAHAISADRIENVQGRVSIARLKKGKCRSDRFGRIVGLRARRIDIGKIGRGLLIASPVAVRLAPRTGRCRRSRSNFCRGCLLSRTSSRKSSPARSRIRYSHWRGFFWRKRPVTMFN